jgi:hypothetical protein
MGNWSSSTRTPHDRYEELLNQDQQEKIVLTRQGFGYAIYSSEVLVRYVYPREKFQGYVKTYVKQNDFIVTRVETDENGCYLVTCMNSKNQGVKRLLTHPAFDKRPFGDETLREIIVRCYENWKKTQEPENPFASRDIFSESSAGGFDEDSNTPFATNDQNEYSEVSVSTEEMAPEYVYEYDDESQ